MEVHRGGMRTAEGFRFELTGGSPCLDLANTVDLRPTAEPRELLPDYGSLVAWAEQAGLLDSVEARRLRREGRRRGREGAAVLRRARELREAIFAAFAAQAAGRRPPGAALERLNAALPGALARLQVTPEGSGYRWDWRDVDRMDAMLPPVVRSAAELLTSENLRRVRECAAKECAWLFLDRSRNRSRRWCDMTVCGNRDKARRHYRRSRAPCGSGG